MKKRLLALALMLMMLLVASLALADWDDWEGFGIGPWFTAGGSVQINLSAYDDEATTILKVYRGSWNSDSTESWRWAAAEAPDSFVIPADVLAEPGLYIFSLSAEDAEGKALPGGWFEVFYAAHADEPLSDEAGELAFFLSDDHETVRERNAIAWLYAPGAEDFWITVDGERQDGFMPDGEKGYYYPAQDTAGIVTLQGFARYADGRISQTEKQLFTTESAGAPEGVVLTSPAYVAAGDDLTFTVSPADRLGGRDIPDETNIYYNVFVQDTDDDWSFVFTAYNERILEGDDGPEYLLTEPKNFTVYADQSNAINNDSVTQRAGLVPGHHYNLRLEAFAKGYDAIIIEQRFFVLEALDEDVVLSINGQHEGTVNVQVNQGFTVRVEAPADVTALRIVWDGDWIDVLNDGGPDGTELRRNADGSVTYEWEHSFGDTLRRAVSVQACYDDLPDEIDWDSLPWQGNSNVVAVQATATGKIGEQRVSLQSAVVHRRDPLTVIIDALGEGAQWAALQAYALREDGSEDWMDRREDIGDLSADTWEYDTSDLQPGQYFLRVEAGAEGLLSRRTDLPFAVTGLGDLNGFDEFEPTFLRAEGTHVKIPRVAGAARYTLEIFDDSQDYKTIYGPEDVQPEETIELPESLFPHAGAYELLLNVYGEDPDENTGWAEEVYALEEPLSEEDVVLLVDGPLQVSSTCVVMVSAPGASFVDLFLDDERVDSDESLVFKGDGIFTFLLEFDEAGQHTLSATAYGKAGEKRLSEKKTIDITSLGSVGVIQMSEIPASLAPGEELTLTFSGVADGDAPENSIRYLLRIHDTADWSRLYNELTDPGVLPAAASFTPDEKLAGHHLRVTAMAFSTGYVTAMQQYMVYVTEEEASDRVFLAVNDTTEAITLPVGENVTLAISAEGATALRFWDGYRYEVLNDRGEWWDENDWQHNTDAIRMGWSFGDTMIRAVYVQASFDEFTEEDQQQAWDNDEDFWETLNWTTGNVVRVTPTAQGRVGMPAIEVSETVERGDYLTVTINDPGEHAEWLELIAVGVMEDDRPEYDRLHVDLPKDEDSYPLTVQFPTISLNAEETNWFTLNVEAAGEGWLSRTTSYQITVTQAEEMEALFTVSNTKPYRNDDVMLQAYAPGAAQLHLYVVSPYDENDIWDWGNWNGESLSTTVSFDDTADYTLYVEADYENEDTREIGERVVVSAKSRGQLPAPTISAPATAQANEALAFTVSGLVPEAKGASWKHWDIWVEDRDITLRDDEGYEYWKPIFAISSDDVSAADGSYDVTIPVNDDGGEPQLIEGHSYQLSAAVDASGYDRGETNVTLLVVGNTDERNLYLEPAEMYIPSHGYNITAYAPGAKRIEIWKHSADSVEAWLDQEGEGEQFFGNTGFDSGEYTLYAIAYYTDDEEEAGERFGNITITVTATDSLNPPTLAAENLASFKFGDDFTFSVSAEGQEYDNWNLRLEDKDDDWQSSWQKDHEGWRDLKESYTIDADVFMEGHAYRLYARLWKEGCDTAESYIDFIAQDESLISGEVKLYVSAVSAAADNITETEATVYAFNPYFLKLTTPEGVTAIEFFDGYDWSYPDGIGEDGVFVRNDEETGVSTFIARVTTDPINEMDYAEITWMQSNAVTVRVTRPLGELEDPPLAIAAVWNADDVETNGLRIAWNTVPDAEEYYIQIELMNTDDPSEGASSFITMSLSPDNELNNGQTTFAPYVSWMQQINQPGFWYRMTLTAVTDGWKPGMSEAYFAVVDPDKTLKLPSALTDIQANAFQGSAAQAVILPEGIQSIGDNAFAGCDSLTVVVVPSEGLDIEDIFGAFEHEPMFITEDEWPF